MHFFILTILDINTALHLDTTIWIDLHVSRNKQT
jgi:hypothetical protein